MTERNSSVNKESELNGDDIDSNPRGSTLNTQLPAFVAEGFIDDISCLCRQSFLHSQGIKVSYLFSEQQVPQIGQSVYIEVRFVKAMPELCNSFVKTIVTRMEGIISRLSPHIIATVRVVDKLVEELIGYWEAVLVRESQQIKQKWRMTALYPSRTPQSDTMQGATNTASVPQQKMAPLAPVTPNAIPLFPQYGAERNKMAFASSSLAHNALFPYDHYHYSRAQSQIYPYALVTPSNPLLSSYAMNSSMGLSTSHPTSSMAMGLMSPFFGFPVDELPRARKRRRRSTTTDTVTLATDVMEKLQEFKQKNKDIAAIANWDLTKYTKQNSTTETIETTTTKSSTSGDINSTQNGKPTSMVTRASIATTSVTRTLPVTTGTTTTTSTTINNTPESPGTERRLKSDMVQRVEAKYPPQMEAPQPPKQIHAIARNPECSAFSRLNY